MPRCSLTLNPYKQKEFAIELLEDGETKRNLDQIIYKSNNIYVFSDLSYFFSLSLDDDSIKIRDVEVFVNDVFEPSSYRDGTITFGQIDDYRERRIFLDCYGFVSISLIIHTESGNEYHYSSDYIPVLVKKGELNESVKQMVSYVYKNQELLLFNGLPKSKDASDLKNNGEKNLSVQITLAEEIARLYEDAYGFFKANSRYKIQKTNVIETFDHVQYITPSSIQYISTHPAELRKITGARGVKIGKNVFQPQNILCERNEISFDTYENRVILGFLYKMIKSIDSLLSLCSDLLDKIPKNESFSSDYLYSSFFMFSETQRSLEKDLLRLNKVRTSFLQLLTNYKDIFPISPDPLTRNPAASFVFLSIPQYNRIFVKMHQWLYYGIYSFEKENYILSLIKISSLYEIYLLIKIINTIKEMGFTLLENKRNEYKVSSKSLYKNTKCDNTFYFKKESLVLILYYQPVIFNFDYSDSNGIALTRNNSISISKDENGNTTSKKYYTPDYLVKLEDGNASHYLIMDAKFSNYDSVRSYHVRDLAFKYLFSISPIKDCDVLEGLCIIYGKCSKTDKLQSAYDYKLDEQTIRPSVNLVPMLEGINNEEHANLIYGIINSLLH